MFSSTPHEEREEAYESQANTREQPHFPLALKKARLARQLKQETLAKRLHVKLRTLVSWETGTRIPSIGIVVLLSLLLTDDLEQKSAITALVHQGTRRRPLNRQATESGFC